MGRNHGKVVFPRAKAAEALKLQKKKRVPVLWFRLEYGPSHGDSQQLKLFFEVTMRVVVYWCPFGVSLEAPIEVSPTEVTMM